MPVPGKGRSRPPDKGSSGLLDVHLSAQVMGDLRREARQLRMGPEVLDLSIRRTLQEHGSNLRAHSVRFDRWIALVEGIPVVYDVIPGSRAMVVAIGKVRAMEAKSIYEATEQNGRR